MTVKIENTTQASTMTYAITPPEWPGTGIPINEKCVLIPKRYADAMIAFLIEQNVKLEALEIYAVEKGASPAVLSSAAQLRCEYFRRTVEAFSQGEKCPHECEKSERVAGCRWVPLDWDG
jgi:hypothetical protein